MSSSSISDYSNDDTYYTYINLSNDVRNIEICPSTSESNDNFNSNIIPRSMPRSISGSISRGLQKDFIFKNKNCYYIEPKLIPSFSLVASKSSPSSSSSSSISSSAFCPSASSSASPTFSTSSYLDSYFSSSTPRSVSTTFSLPPRTPLLSAIPTANINFNHVIGNNPSSPRLSPLIMSPKLSSSAPDPMPFFSLDSSNNDNDDVNIDHSRHQKRLLINSQKPRGVSILETRDKLRTVEQNNNKINDVPSRVNSNDCGNIQENNNSNTNKVNYYNNHHNNHPSCKDHSSNKNAVHVNNISIIREVVDENNKIVAESTLPLPLLTAALRKQKFKSCDISLFSSISNNEFTDNNNDENKAVHHTSKMDNAVETVPISILPLPSECSVLVDRSITKVNETVTYAAVAGRLLTTSTSKPYHLPHSHSFSGITSQVSNNTNSSHQHDCIQDTYTPPASHSSNYNHNHQQQYQQHQHQYYHSHKFSSSSPADRRSMSRLSSFSSLLSQCNPSTYLVLDLDETVYLGLYHPCAMMKEKGLAKYQSILTHHPWYQYMSHSKKTNLTRLLQTAVSSKRGVESDTIESIKKLQERKVPLFALTARYTSMISTTQKELQSLGLDLSLTSPFPPDGVHLGDECDAVYADGVIYTNAKEKGPVLNKVLTVLFQKHLENLSQQNEDLTRNNRKLETNYQSTNNLKYNTASFSSSPSFNSLSSTSSSFSRLNFLPASRLAFGRSITLSLPSPIIFKTSKKLRMKKFKGKFLDEDIQSTEQQYSNSIQSNKFNQNHFLQSNNNNNGNRHITDQLPNRLVFVDDRLQNCVSVLNGLRVCDDLNMEICTYHYTPEKKNEKNKNNKMMRKKSSPKNKLNRQYFSYRNHQNQQTDDQNESGEFEEVSVDEPELICSASSDSDSTSSRSLQHSKNRQSNSTSLSNSKWENLDYSQSNSHSSSPPSAISSLPLSPSIAIRSPTRIGNDEMSDDEGLWQMRRRTNHHDKKKSVSTETVISGIDTSYKRTDINSSRYIADDRSKFIPNDLQSLRRLQIMKNRDVNKKRWKTCDKSKSKQLVNYSSFEDAREDDGFYNNYFSNYSNPDQSNGSSHDSGNSGNMSSSSSSDDTDSDSSNGEFDDDERISTVFDGSNISCSDDDVTDDNGGDEQDFDNNSNKWNNVGSSIQREVDNDNDDDDTDDDDREADNELRLIRRDDSIAEYQIHCFIRSQIIKKDEIVKREMKKKRSESRQTSQSDMTASISSVSPLQSPSSSSTTVNSDILNVRRNSSFPSQHVLQLVRDLSSSSSSSSTSLTAPSSVLPSSLPFSYRKALLGTISSTLPEKDFI